MKVAILTMFKDLEKNSSLVNIVAEHLKMLLGADIDVKLLIDEDFLESSKFGVYLDCRIEWRKICTTLQGEKISKINNLKRNKKVHESFIDETEAISESLKNNLLDVDVCIIYDVDCKVMQFLYNIALRKVQEVLTNIKFIVYTYSNIIGKTDESKWPSSGIYTSMPNMRYVCQTDSEIPILAKQFNAPEGKCSVIYNNLDAFEHLSEDIKVISSKVDLITPDILIIYPARLTTGKKLEKVVTFAAAIKKRIEKSVRIVFCDFPSSDIHPDIYKALLKRLGKALDLNENDIIFTSDLGYKSGFPRKGVLDLFTLSNLFVCPSFSESFGLIALEAASRGNFLVLNEKVPALEELGKQLHAYFMRWDARNFGFDTKEIYHPSEQEYLEENAAKVIELMGNNPVIHAKTMLRQGNSRKWIWENQLKPLLEN